MKRIKRVILSITRRPIKSLLLLLVIFVVSNIISGSLILYNTTQSIKEEVLNQILPSVIIETPLDNVIYRNLKLDKVTAEDNYEYIENYILALNEISNLNEVKYADYGIYNLFNTVKKYSYDFRHHYYSNVFNFKNAYNDIRIYGVNNRDHYYLYKNMIQITEGRNFTEDEILNGSPVILLPENTRELYVYDRYVRKKENGIQIGDKIQIVYRVLSEMPENELSITFNRNNENVASQEVIISDEEMQSLNDEFDSIILDEQIFEVEVIGFYKWDDVSLDELSSNSYEIDAYTITPLNFILNVFNDYYESSQKSLNEGLVQIEDEYGKVVVNDDTRYIQYNYFELNDSESIKSFTAKAKEIINKYDLDGEFLINNDLYLKVVGPLETINSVSKTILIIASIISFVVLSCISIIFLKDRKKELGILLSLGEEKRHVITQIMLEMLIIGMFAFSISLFTSKSFSETVSNTIFESYEKTELTSTENMMIEEGFSQDDILNKYETELETISSLKTSFATIVILLLSTGCSTFVIIKMKPKDILM